ncbi:MAG TPA: TonB family protein [Polyangia bacterium]|nr:TonB family protein [Polyangia bacterium]
MKLAQSLLVAAALHGVVFGVAAAVLSSSRPVAPVRAAIEVDVVAPRPEPASESASAPAPSTARDAARPAAAIHRHRAVPRGVLATAMHPTDAASGQPEPLVTHDAPAAGNCTAARPAVAGTSAGVTASATPRYRTNPVPEYPIPSRRRREEGIVYLNVTVQPNGWPAAVSLNRSSGHPLLDQAALDAVRRWTFEPGRAGGVPVSSLVVVPVRFFLSELR